MVTKTDPDRMRKPAKKKVLFICTHNSNRSQIAEGLLRAAHGESFDARSAGTHPTEVDPRAIRVMGEAGIDVTSHRSKNIDEFREMEFDYVVTLCDRAKEACPFFPQAARQLHKSFENPVDFRGTESEIITAFRNLRDEIKVWIQNTFGEEDEKQLKESDRYRRLLESIKWITTAGLGRQNTLLAVCVLLGNVPGYDWVGLYMVDESRRRQLVLGPYVGEPTEHKRISFGKGICGQAAEREATVVVQDVAKETNYLSCSPKVKSEIVVPIFRSRKMVGELDIDSHQLSRFAEEDRILLEEVAEVVSEVI